MDPGRLILISKSLSSGVMAEDLELTQNTYMRVFEAGGRGSTRVQEALLHHIACSHNPDSIPFWLQIMATTRKGDKQREERMKVAVAAIAFIALKHDHDNAYHTLRQTAYYPNPQIRAHAIHYLGRAYLEAERPIPYDVLEELQRIAISDPIFDPRFQARATLRTAQQDIPLDHPNGTYTLKLMPLLAKRIHRTIEIRSEQTLRDLQRFIHHALEWDDDHLFCFYMNGRKYDPLYSFACAYEEDRPPWAYEAIIGELGLVKGHRFLYHFDYGDDHLFEIEVTDIRPDVRAGNYPRLVDSHGKMFPQYG